MFAFLTGAFMNFEVELPETVEGSFPAVGFLTEAYFFEVVEDAVFAAYFRLALGRRAGAGRPLILAKKTFSVAYFDSSCPVSTSLHNGAYLLYF